MNYRIAIVTGVLAGQLGLGIAMADELLDDSDIGLSKTSVFDTPSPAAFTYAMTDPEDSEALPRAFPGAPPQIPHEIQSMLPILVIDNQCIDCHDKPRSIGKKRKGRSPMPESHYSVTGADKSKWKLSGARFTCNQCHVPQADVGPLVNNTFVNLGVE